MCLRDCFDSSRLRNTCDQEKTQSCIRYDTSSETHEPFVLSAQELSVSDEDKHCFSCEEANDECLTSCPWTQRCYFKAKHANATSTWPPRRARLSRLRSRLVHERQCTSERWARELLADGCLTYMKSYWCMCSADSCNGGDVDSIRGTATECARANVSIRSFRLRRLFEESLPRWKYLPRYEGRFHLHLCALARRLHAM